MNQFDSAVLTIPNLIEPNRIFIDSSNLTFQIPLIISNDINDQQTNIENFLETSNSETISSVQHSTFSTTDEIYNQEETNKSNKKQRIVRYCPREKDIFYELECEFDECKMVFNDMDLFLNHIDNHLSNYFLNLEEQTLSSQKYECKWNDCDSEPFFCDSTFQRHVRFHAFHTKLKQIGLSVLKNDTKQIPKCNLDDQTRNFIPILPYKFECSYDSCQYKTDNPELFYRHIRNQHVMPYPSKLINQKCKWSQCEQIISNKNRFVEHLRHHSQEKLVACPNCGALFASISKFIDHCSRSSEIGSLCYQCSHCNKKFSTNNLLKEHIRKHVNRFKCPICDMTCTAKNDLSKHILYKHTTHKSLKCSYCDHCSKTQHDLQKHINLKHHARHEYQCNECEFKSKDINLIKKHMVKSHMNLENANGSTDTQHSNGSYMCHVCNKVYGHGATLSRHLKSIHNFQWPSGHSRFRYKLESDGFFRLQTVRYESLELIQQLNKDADIINNLNQSSNSNEQNINYSILNRIECNTNSMEMDQNDQQNTASIIVEQTELGNDARTSDNTVITEKSVDIYYEYDINENQHFTNNNDPHAHIENNPNSRIDFDIENIFNANTNTSFRQSQNNLKYYSNNFSNGIQFDNFDNNSLIGIGSSSSEDSDLKAYFINNSTNHHSDHQNINSNFSLHTNQ